MLSTGYRRHFQFLLCGCFAILTTGLLIAGSAMAQQERPSAEQLLPETTVVYVEFTNVRDLYEKMQRSNGGQLMADEAIAPLLGDLMEQGKKAYKEFVEPEIELTAEELLSLPSGQITFAFIAPKRKKPVFVFMVEMEEESEAVQKFFEVGRTKAEEAGQTIETEETDEVTFNSVVSEGQRITYFMHQNMLVGGNSQEELDDIVDRWFGREVEKVRPLEKNRKFVTIMNRCNGTAKFNPDLKFFVDPIDLARSAFRGEMQAQFVINFLPILGLDGLLAVGGASSSFVDEFESVFHGHVLLSSPRKGVFEMLALKPADYRPQSWIPESATTYYSTSIDLNKMVSELEKIVDLFSSEGTFRSQIDENFNEELGIDFDEDLIASLSGRVTAFTWMEPPARFTGQVFGLGAELKDEKAAKRVMDAIYAKFEEENPDGFEKIEERTFKGQTYWAFKTISDDDDEEDDEPQGDDNDVDFETEINIPEPCWGFIEDHFIVSFSPELYELMIETHRGDKPTLVDNEQYSRVTKKMTNLLKDDMPCFSFYQDPREAIKAFMDAARLDNSGKYFDWVEDQVAEDDLDEDGGAAKGMKYLRGVREAMEKNPLPEFEDIEKYFQPNGMFVTNEESGYHMLWFQLASEEQEKEMLKSGK